jgi:hypothetical protein
VDSDGIDIPINIYCTLNPRSLFLASLTRELIARQINIAVHERGTTLVTVEALGVVVVAIGFHAVTDEMITTRVTDWLALHLCRCAARRTQELTVQLNVARGD